MSASQPDYGFPPVERPDARVLVLGSMPSQQSLDQQQYYGNPHNAFWKILSDFTGVASDASYSERVEGATNAGIAIWDVIKTCVRPGSLDASIETASIEVNHFSAFFSDHTHIRGVFLNGAKAAQEYERRVIPVLPPSAAALTRVTLLSTSPANARYSLEDKKANWSVLHDYLESS